MDSTPSVDQYRHRVRGGRFGRDHRISPTATVVSPLTRADRWQRSALRPPQSRSSRPAGSSRLEAGSDVGWPPCTDNTSYVCTTVPLTPDGATDERHRHDDIRDGCRLPLRRSPPTLSLSPGPAMPAVPAVPSEGWWRGCAAPQPAAPLIRAPRPSAQRAAAVRGDLGVNTASRLSVSHPFDAPGASRATSSLRRGTCLPSWCQYTLGGSGTVDVPRLSARPPGSRRSWRERSRCATGESPVLSTLTRKPAGQSKGPGSLPCGNGPGPFRLRVLLCVIPSPRMSCPHRAGSWPGAHAAGSTG